MSLWRIRAACICHPPHPIVTLADRACGNQTDNALEGKPSLQRWFVSLATRPCSRQTWRDRVAPPSQSSSMLAASDFSQPRRWGVQRPILQPMKDTAMHRQTARVAPTAAAPRLIAAEFFAGVGLVGEALQAEGIQVVWANDIDPLKRRMFI